MQIGLVGLSNSGKTTLFQLLTGIKDSAFSPGKTNKGIFKVPDGRVDYLSSLFKPKKTTHATLEAVDIPGLIPGTDRSTVSFLNSVREADVLVNVIQDFDSAEAPHMEGSLDLMRDLEMVIYELLLADLDQIEKRLERMKKGKPGKDFDLEAGVLSRCKEALEKENPISSLEMTPEEDNLVRNFRFLTAKPYVVVVNVDEGQLLAPETEHTAAIIDHCRKHNIPLLFLSAKIESEIADLEGEDRLLFLSELGIEESGLVLVSRLVYQRLGLISFFTVGEDEVKAWTITAGMNAREAAGKIHSDIERGFIRAEVVSFEAFQRAGSMANARTEGTFRLEGKEYVVKDGDIVHFRFNV